MLTPTQTLALAVLLLPSLTSPRAPVAKLRFAPAEGSKVEKTFENDAEFTLDSLSVKLNGQDSPMMPEMEMTMTSKQKVVVTDTFEANREGAPKKLRRRFDSLDSDVSVSMRVEMMGQTQNQDQSIEGKSELEGKNVVFTWDAEKGEYTKAFDPEEESQDLIKNLLEDMDLRALLPAGEVKEGESWDLEVKKLGSLLSPGGNLAILPESVQSSQMMGMPGMGSMSDWLLGMLEGTASATFAGMREVDGDQLAVIKFQVKVSVATDLSEMVAEAMKNAELPPGAGELELDHMDIDVKLEAEGELLWNPGQGLAHSLEASGPSTVVMDMGMQVEAQGRSMKVDYVMEMSGTTTLKARFE